MSVWSRRSDWSDFYWDMGRYPEMVSDELTRRQRRAALKASRDGRRMRGRNMAGEARLLRAEMEKKR